MGDDGLKPIGHLAVDARGDVELIDCRALTPELQASIERRIVGGGDRLPDRIQRSWVWVDYVAELLASAAIMWLRGERVGDLSRSNMAVELTDEGFERFYVREPAPEATPAGTDRAMRQVLDRAIDHHAAAMLQRASASTGVGPRNLWGSVAASIVSASVDDFRHRGRILPVDRLRAFLDRRPELSAKGEIIVLDDRRGPPAVGYHRATCCLWFRVDPGERCGGCMLSSREEAEREIRSAVPVEGA